MDRLTVADIQRHMIVVCTTVPSTGVGINQNIARLQGSVCDYVATRNIDVLFRPTVEVNATGRQRLTDQCGAVHALSDQRIRTVDRGTGTSGNRTTGIGISNRRARLITARGVGLIPSRLSLGLRLLLGLLFGNLLGRCGILFRLRFRLRHIEVLNATPISIVLNARGSGFSRQIFAHLGIRGEGLGGSHSNTLSCSCCRNKHKQAGTGDNRGNNGRSYSFGLHRTITLHGAH